MDKILLSSDRQDWETPWSLIRTVEKRLLGGSSFDVDVCAKDAAAAKARVFYSPELDGLSRRWSGRCWCNPPYGREQIKWVTKARDESTLDPGCMVVCLLPARTDTVLFHEVIVPHAHVYLLKGRIRFEVNGVPGDPAPFPSMLAVFRGESDLGLETLCL